MTRRQVETRLRRLEGPRRTRIAVMWRHTDEPDDAAYQRWQIAHPGETLSDADLRVIIVRWTTSDERVAP